MSPETATKSKKLNLLEGLTLPNVFKWLGITLLVFVLFTLTYLYAIDPFQKPSDVRVTNLSDRSATISWVTEKPSKGIVIYGENSSFMPGILASVGQEIAYDDRDVAKAVLEGAEELEGNLESRDQAVSSSDLENNVKVTTAGRYYVHHVTVKNLDPNTEYFFRIGDGVRFVTAEGDFADDEFTVSTSAEFMTFPELDDLKSPNPTYGKVISDDEEVDVVNDGIVFVKPGLSVHSSPISSVTNDEGNWYADLSNVRDLDVPISILSFDEDDDSHAVFVEAGQYGESLYIIEPMYADAPMVDITVSNDWEEEGSEEESNSFVFSAYAAKDEKDKDAKDPKKYNENGKIKKTYADQLKRRAARGDYVDPNEVAAAASDRGIIIEVPKKQEPATTGGGGGCYPNPNGGPTNTEVSVDPDGDGVYEDYMAYCCGNGLWGDAALGADNACKERDGLVGPDGTVTGGGNQLTACESPNILCSVDNGNSVECLPRPQCSVSEDGEVIEDITAWENELIWCVPPGRSTDVLISRKSCNRQCGLHGESDCVASSNVVSSPPGTPPGNVPGNSPSTGADTDRVRCRLRTGQTPTTSRKYCEDKDGVVEEEHGSVDHSNDTVCILSNGNSTFTASEDACFNRGGNPLTESERCEIDGQIYPVVGEEACTEKRQELELARKVEPTANQTCPFIGAIVQYNGNTYICRYVDFLGTPFSYYRGGPLLRLGNVEWATYIGEDAPETRVPGCYNPDTGETRVNDSGNCKGEESAITVEARICQDPNGCSCGYDTTVSQGGFCSEDTIESIPTLQPGGNCSATRCLCEYGQDRMVLIGRSNGCPASFPEDDREGWGNLVSSAFAQNSIAISGKNGLFAIENSGLYCTVYREEKYCFEVVDSGNKFLYIDVNNNGGFDKGDVNVADDALKLRLTLESKTSSLSLKEGFNLVAFNLVNGSIGTTAKDWLKYLNEQYNDNFYSISKFESGKWVVIENRDGETYGTDDFQIVPGQGYLLKVKNDMVLNLFGKAVVDPVPVNLQAGWNLIGINGASKGYTAESLIDDLNALDTVVSDNVTRWDTSVSRYIGLQKEASAVYGIDFPLSSMEAYFVRVKQGSGVWTPQ